MKTVLKYLKKYKLECFMAPLFKLLEACFDLFVPVVVKMIMDVGIKNNDTSYIIHGCLVLVALGVIGLTCSIIAQYFAARAAVGTSTGLRHDLFSHLQGLSYSNADKLQKIRLPWEKSTVFRRENQMLQKYYKRERNFLLMRYMQKKER